MSEVEKLVERLRNVTEEDAYAHPWTFGELCREAARRAEELEGALRKIIATIRAMDDEYNLDNECDYTKINEFIEVLADLADLSEGSGSSRELAPPDESGDAQERANERPRG